MIRDCQMNGSAGQATTLDEGGGEFAILKRPYLLVILIPVYRDETGTLWLERAWHQDLIQHLHYITDLRLCAPVLPKGNQPNLVRIDLTLKSRLRILPLPAQLS